MSYLEIKESAENTSRTLISVVYYVNLVLCIIAMIAGIAMIIDYEDVGIYVIIAAVIYIFWLTLLKALLDTFVNISVKLDRDKEIIKDLQKMVSLLEGINKPKVEEPKPSDINIEKVNTNKPKPAKIDKTKISEAHSEIKVDLENEILGEIIAGNEMNARLMLMQKKGLSLGAAIAFIEETKNNIK